MGSWFFFICRRGHRKVAVEILMYVFMGCFKISPSHRKNQPCSSCEMVSKKSVFTIAATRLQAQFRPWKVCRPCFERRNMRHGHEDWQCFVFHAVKRTRVIQIYAAEGGLFTEMWSHSPCSAFCFVMSLLDEDILAKRCCRLFRDFHLC